MHSSWLVLLPPLLVVILAAVTRKTIMSLLVGLFSAVLIVYDFSFPVAAQQLVLRVFATTELAAMTSWSAFWGTWYLLVCLFLLLLGVVMTMIRYSGGAYAYGNMVMKYLKTAKNAEASSLLLSMFFFIDDYFSCLTVGSVMQTVTDRFRVPRAKLGVLVNGMAASLAVAVPVSSWVAEIIGQLRNSGIAMQPTTGTVIVADAFYCYLQTIPYLFYSFITIGSLWFIVLRRISFGVLHKHEEVAQRTGNLFAGKIPVTRRLRDVSQDAIMQSSILDFFVPIGLLFGSVMVSVLYFGGYHLFGGSNSLVLALQKTQIAAALFSGALVTAFGGMTFLLARKKLTFRQIPMLWREGVGLMLPSVIILILIWTLSSLLKNDLMTGKFLASHLVGSLNLAMLPVVFFILAVVTSCMMGSAWGTIGIYFPIGLQMLTAMSGLVLPVGVDALPILFPLIGAIISGAIVGNHLSPISDTMLMASTSSGAYHIDLVRAQVSVTVPTVVAAAISFFTVGIFLLVGMSGWLAVLASMGIGLVWNFAQFSVLHLLSQKKIF